MTRTSLAAILPLLAWLAAASPSPLAAAEYRLERLAEEAPEELSAEVRGTLAPSGFRLIRGESRAVCDLWLCKQWKVGTRELPADVLYPFTPGQLIGAIRYPRKGADFRDQDIASGVYTLRFSLQPVDGAHVGTSITRDFLLLLPAAADTDPAVLEYKPLVERSQEAAQSNHPALLSMQKVRGEGEAGTVREEEASEWQIVRLKGETLTGEKAEELLFDLVVVGVAAE